MKIKLPYFLIILLLPGFAEAIDSNVFLISIPGFPLSVGRLLFVISGIILITRDQPNVLRNKSFIGFLLVISGITLASLIFADTNAFIQSLGFLLVFIGSFGNVNLWGHKVSRQILDIFFVFLFVYWTFKSIIVTLVSGSQSYSESYLEGAAINHHVPGMLVSISSAYIAIRFFYSDNRLKLLGYAVFFVAMITCLFIESRSNFLISMAIMLLVALRGKTRRIKQLIRIVPVLLIITFATYHIIRKSEVFSRRFTLNDMAYQKRSSGMRVAYLEQGLDDFISNPFGKGIQDTRVEYKGRKFSIHNQYLTFLVGGGVISLIGLLFLFFSLVKLNKVNTLFQEDNSDISHKFLLALANSSIVFFVTLLTIEMSGILLFIMISFLLFVEREVLTMVSLTKESLLEEN